MPPPDSSPIDLDAVHRWTGGSVELFDELIDIFNADWPQRRDALRAGIAGGDGATARRTAHSLKTSLNVLGATDATEMARALEGHFERGELAAAAPLVARLEREVERIVVALRDLRPSGGRPA